MKKPSSEKNEAKKLHKLMGLGETSIQKSYYPQLHVKIEELKSEKEKYQSIFDNAFNGIFRTDSTGMVIEANQAMARILAYDSPEHIAHTLNWVEEVLKKSKHWLYIEAELDNGNTIKDLEIMINTQLETTVWVSMNFRKIIVKSTIQYEGFIEDITQKKKMQEQILHNNKMDAIGHLAGGIAHDFNNILTGILGAAEVLKVNAIEKQQKYVDIIINAAQRGADLTSKLIVYGNFEKLHLQCP